MAKKAPVVSKICKDPFEDDENEPSGSSKNQILNVLVNEFASFPMEDPKTFADWLKQSSTSKKQNVITEIEADLFSMQSPYCLANCVAEDINMGAGIAVTFRTSFKNIDALLDQRATVGGVAFLSDGDRYIYYLITKRLSTDKPTNVTIFKSLQTLKELMLKHGMNKIAIPQLGCGLDRLKWEDVSSMIVYLFEDTNVKFTVCNHKKAEEDMQFKRENHRSRKCFAKTMDLPISRCGIYRIVIYLGTVNKQEDTQFKNLVEKFPTIKKDYINRPANMGDMIETIVQNYQYFVCGCIARQSAKHQFSFKHFDQCLKKIHKRNAAFGKTQEHYRTVAIQCYKDGQDDLLMEKITNLIINTLWGVDIEIYQ